MQRFKYVWGSKGITVQSFGLSYLICVSGGTPIGESTIINNKGRIEVDNINARGTHVPGAVMIDKDQVVTVLETCPLMKAKAEAREFEDTPWGDVDEAVEQHRLQCEHRDAMAALQDPRSWAKPKRKHVGDCRVPSERFETVAMT